MHKTTLLIPEHLPKEYVSHHTGIWIQSNLPEYPPVFAAMGFCLKAVYTKIETMS